MSDVSWAAIVRLVHERARNYCEYCQTYRDIIGQAMHVEHIDPNGGDSPENLCLACPTCNLSKATATFALDPTTGVIVPLFNPRTQRWDDRKSESALVEQNNGPETPSPPSPRPQIGATRSACSAAIQSCRR